MTKKLQPLIIVFCFSLIIMSCDRKRTDKGYEYFPDMAHSLAYETYDAQPVTDINKSMLLPPAHTVPLEMEPYMYDSSPESRELAAKELINPYTLTEEGLIRGKEQYKIFCAHCHGDKGDGMGFKYTSGKYPIKPASLISERMISLNDADIFHVITVGYQLMGPHGHMIRPADRWMIALYVKNELQKQ